MKKKLLTILTCVLAVFSLTGCVGLRSSKTSTEKKQDADYVINENRQEERSQYTYDWVDYLNINVYGTDGSAYLQITPRTDELKSTDFSSDDDFLAIRTALNSMNLTYLGDGTDTTNQSSNISVDWSYNLSSGNVITISLNSSSFPETVYTGDYEYRVGTLKETQTLDLFSEENVLFYALDGLNEVYYIYPEHSEFRDVEGLIDNIYYDVIPDSNEIVKDQTILDIEIQRDKNFTQNTGYSSLTMYLATVGYKFDEYKTQMVLHNVANQVDFSNAMLAKKTVDLLFDKIVSLEGESGDGEGAFISTICSIQKLNKDSDDPYKYYVVYRDTSGEGSVNYYRRTVRFANLDGNVIIISMGAQEKSSEDFANNAYTDGEIVYINTVVETLEENNEEPVETQEETVQEDAVDE